MIYPGKLTQTTSITASKTNRIKRSSDGCDSCGTFFLNTTNGDDDMLIDGSYGSPMSDMVVRNDVGDRNSRNPISKLSDSG